MGDDVVDDEAEQRTDGDTVLLVDAKRFVVEDA